MTSLDSNELGSLRQIQNISYPVISAQKSGAGHRPPCDTGASQVSRVIPAATAPGPIPNAAMYPPRAIGKRVHGML